MNTDACGRQKDIRAADAISPAVDETMTLVLAISKIANALGTVAIAAFVAWVAFRQHKTAKDQLKLDLFEKRYAVYRMAVDYLLAARFPHDPEEFSKLYDSKLIDVWHEAQFLFPDNRIADSLQRLRDPVYEIQSLFMQRDALLGGGEARSLPPTDKRELSEIWKKQVEFGRRLDAELKQLSELFMQYLRITERL